MAYRAYGQIRRGAGPWRTPFLIPVGDLVPPVIWPSSYVSIDTGGAAPDLRLALIIDSFNSLSDMKLKFRIQKFSSNVQDITLRIVVLKSSDDFFVDSGNFSETDVDYAVLHHGVAPGVQFPDELDLRLNIGNGLADPAIDDPNTTIIVPNPATAPPTARWCDTIGIEAQSSESDPLDMAGGMVTGNVIDLTGVETAFQPDNILNPTTGSYHEGTAHIRGIDLSWLDGPSTLPPSATWIAFKAVNPTADPSLVDVNIYLPQTGLGPTAAPAVATRAGGSLRVGTYRYRLTYLEQNGNESSPGPRSGPITIGATGNKSVRIDNFPPHPDWPVPDPSGGSGAELRIYRTDPDLAPVTGPDADPDAGDSGDDVLVGEIPLDASGVPTATFFDDTGVYNPADPGPPGSLRSDLMVIEYSSPQHHTLTGSARMISGATDTSPASDNTYAGKVTTAPNKVRVVYQPGTSPLIRWSADDDTPALGITLGSLDTPLGKGVQVDVVDVPTRLGINWSILGSEFFTLGLAAASKIDPSSLTSRSIGRASARIGVAAPPMVWPVGDADIAVELWSDTAPRTGTSGGPGAGALISMADVRMAVVTQGAHDWADRDAAVGRYTIAAKFATPKGKEHHDRDLRVTRHSGGDDDALQDLQLTGHLVPEDVLAVAAFPSGGTPTIDLDSEVRWLRGNLVIRDVPKPNPDTPDVPPGMPTNVKGTVFLDDTTSEFHAEVGGEEIIASVANSVRLGGRVDITTDGDTDDKRIVARPDVILPARRGKRGGPTTPSLHLTGIKAPADIEATVPEPGLSGRAAISFGNDLPVVVRANPQVKLLQHGDAETTTGMRAASVRVLGITNAKVPRGLMELGDDKPAPGVVQAVLHLSPERPNSSFRAEMQERESRITFPVDDRATAGVRSWLRARTAHLPNQLTADIGFVAAGMATDFKFGGLGIAASETWGAGVIWAEPSSAWTTHTDELGTDKGIGLITAGWDNIPANTQVWMLEHAGDLGTTRVPTSIILPSVGPADSNWPGGGAVIRVDGSIALNHIMMATPGDASRVCRTDDGDDRPVRHGNWSEVISPFIKLTTTESGLKDLVIWSTGDAVAPADPSAPEVDPCNPPDGGPSRKTVLGWMIDPTLRASMAVRLYSLNTPSGIITPRWWHMPTSSEDWENVDNPEPGIWHLDQEVQMKDYANTIAFYTDEGLDNPFGSWEDGPGTWWLRIRDGLDAFLGSGDAYMGNVGGGYHFPFSNGIFSTLPAIWSWSYP